MSYSLGRRMFNRFVIGLFGSLLKSQTSPSPFLEKPYLQLGDSPNLMSRESLVLLWHTKNAPAEWTVEVRNLKDSMWRSMAAPSSQSVSAPAGPAMVAGVSGAKTTAPPSPAIEPHLVYRAQMTGLNPGQEFRYRVLKSGKPVFESTAMARKSASQPYRFVLFGDCGQGTPSENAIAYQASLAKPDFVFIPGDIVYSSGRIAEYRSKFFPVYNADRADAETGAPLIRSIPFIAAPGNHDTALNNYAHYPDALAYFLYWDQPLNGPIAAPNSAKTSHLLVGNAEAQSAFLEAAGPRYPRMANFSFNYGNSHWTVLDANVYMDWTNPALRDWLAKDLEAARSATFRFVAFHQPGFNSAHEHFTDQWMRTLAPTFEANQVDVVFAGHVHNYQRSFPLTFKPAAQPDGLPIGPKGEVAGEWKLDKTFNNGASAKPKGVIYLVSGGGGAGLYNPEQEGDPSSWQPFTDKFLSRQHSLSIVEVSGSSFRMKQMSESGQELDSFQITK